MGILLLGQSPILYEGFVATGGRALFASTVSFNQAMGRSEHIAGEALTSIKLCVSNFIVNEPDTGVGAAATVTASIEYPSGTVTQVKFSGIASVSVPNVGTAFSDYTTVSIPSGATFWVRIYYTNVNGIVYLDHQIPGSAEQFAVAISGLSDQTMSGAAISGGTSQTWAMPPLAIIGHTIKPSVLVIGDSRATVNGGSDRQGTITPSLSIANVPFVCIADFSATANTWFTKATARNALLPYGSQVLVAIGINDIRSDFLNRTPAQAIADIQTIFAACGATKKYCTTIEPYTSSTDAWITTVNQTSLCSVSVFNDLIRAGFTGLTGFYECADQVTSSHNSNIWKAPAGVAYTFDGLHATQAGQDAITNSGVIVPAAYP